MEYEYEGSESEADQLPLDLTLIAIPKALLQSLVEAAEFQSLTQLKEALDELDALGEAEHRLAEHLRAQLRNYDMEAIMNLLSEIQQT